MKWILLLIFPVVAGAQEIAESKLKFGSFGTVHVYQRAGVVPTQIVLFGSGDGGWNQGEIQMAQAMVEDQTAIVGFNTTALIKGMSKPGRACMYPAGDLELLSKFVQSKLGVVSYSLPVLAGFSSGAALAYGALAQAPEATFSAVLSFGFCTDLEARLPLCKGSGFDSKQVGKKARFIFTPTTRSLPNWYAFNNAEDKACPAAKSEPFVSQVAGGNFVPLTGGGHGYAVKKDWLPKYREILATVRTTEKPSAEVESVAAGLPVIPLPASKESSSDRFVVFLSGDGGWAGFDRDLSKAYNDAGVSVLGFNSLKYFWSKKTAEQGAKDLAALIESYAAKWGKPKVTVVGFSFGAEVAPFFVSRLPEKSKRRVDELVLLSPSKSATFEFHVSDWIKSSSRGSPIKPELDGLAGALQLKCIYGEKESGDTVCTQLKADAGKVVRLPGGHHFDVDSKVLLQKIGSI